MPGFRAGHGNAHSRRSGRLRRDLASPATVGAHEARRAAAFTLARDHSNNQTAPESMLRRHLGAWLTKAAESVPRVPLADVLEEANVARRAAGGREECGGVRESGAGVAARSPGRQA